MANACSPFTLQPRRLWRRTAGTACRLTYGIDGCALTSAFLRDTGKKYAEERDDKGRTPLFFTCIYAGMHALLAAEATDVNAKDAAGCDAVAARIVGSVPLPVTAIKIINGMTAKDQVSKRVRSS